MGSAPRGSRALREANRAGPFPTGALLAGCGLGLLLLAASFGPWIAEPLHRADELPPEGREQLRSGRQTLLATGAGLLALAAVSVHLGFLRRRVGFRASLVVLALLLPPLVIESLAGPFVTHPTTIYRRHPELGWEHVPGAQDFWFGVPVRINAHGARGPLVPFEKPEGERRIVWIGDSVVFGAFVEDDEDTLPALIEARFSRPGHPLRSVNLAVSGYSTWQEAIVLEQRGFAYEPDLVVLGFVLNDVTERLELVRFGGDREGYHLENKRLPGLRGRLRSLSTVRIVQRWRAERRFGRDVQRGAAEAELLDVWTTMLHPDREDVQAAWRLTIESLDAIAELCEQRGVPLLVVCFPYVDQLGRPALGAPQAVLGGWARGRGLDYLDLLPALAAWCRRTGVAPDDLFVDALHPNAAGFLVLGELVADHLRRSGLLETP